MKKRCRLLVVLAMSAGLLLLPPVGRAHAQAKPAPAPPPAAAPVSADELERLIGTLQNDQARAQLIEQLRGLVAAERGLEEKETEAAPATIFDNVASAIDAIGGELLAAVSVVVDAPRLFSWLGAQVSDRASRGFWLEVALRLSIIFGTALFAEWVLRILLRRPAARLAVRTNEASMAGLLLLVPTVALEILPVLFFAGIAYIALLLLKPHFATAQVAEVVIGASLWARGSMAIAHIILLSPAALPLHGLGEETRNYLYIWARRFVTWSIYGYAVAAAAWWLGVPGAIYALLLRGSALVLAVLGVIFVLQNRVPVGQWLRGRAQAARGPTGLGEGQGWRLLRERLADTWHIPVIFYILATLGVFVLRINGGFVYVARATVMSIVVMLVAILIVAFARRLSQRGFAIRPELKLRFPTLEARANRYLPVLTVVAAVIVYALAALTVLQVWGIEAYAWLRSDLGHRLTGSLMSIAAVLVVALILWELFSTAIERYLAGVDSHGRAVARSARMRTLLPLLRTTMLVLLIVIVSFIVLSEIGVNIAPLLAGAGIAGIAIGIGSQALVKDFITGLFILIEDSFAVGEVVDVGKGHVGLVESISIRSFRLRDMAGTVHTIPYSEVTTIRNMTRDYAYVVADIGVVYREDPDDVIAVLRQVAAELAAEPPWSSAIVAPLDVVGVDRFTDTAMVIRIRLKTTPLQQWEVGRELNRRIKKAFDAHGIEMPAGNQTRYLDEAGAAGGKHEAEARSLASR